MHDQVSTTDPLTAVVAPDELVEEHSNWEPPTELPGLSDPVLYINNNLSHLQFNLRVLAQSVDEDIPLIERLRFTISENSNRSGISTLRPAASRLTSFPPVKGPSTVTIASAVAVSPANVRLTVPSRLSFA